MEIPRLGGLRASDRLNLALATVAGRSKLRGDWPLEIGRHSSPLNRSSLNEAVDAVREERNAEQQGQWSSSATTMAIKSDKVLNDKE